MYSIVLVILMNLNALITARTERQINRVLDLRAKHETLEIRGYPDRKFQLRTININSPKAIPLNQKFFKTKLKADADTLHYDGSPTSYDGFTFRYYFCVFDLDSAKLVDSTWTLTSGLIFLYSLSASATCSLLVYDIYGNLKAKKPFSGHIGWNEVTLDDPLHFTNDFYLMFYVPADTLTGPQVTFDDGSDPDTMSGVYDGQHFYYLTDADFNIRAVGHYEKIHDAGASAFSFLSYPYTVDETDTVFYYFKNYGNYDENVPVTYILESDIFTDTLSIGIKKEKYTTVEFTPYFEQIMHIKSWTALPQDAVPENDTFAYTIYVFPSYSAWAQGLEFIDSFPPPGWTVWDGDGDGHTWDWYSGSNYTHTGFYFTASRWNPSGNDDWLITPPIPVLYENSTSFGLFARSISSSYPESLEVWVLGSQSPSDTMELVFASSLPDTLYYRITFGLDKYRGDTIYIGIRNAGIDKFYLIVDDIFLREVPLPENVTFREGFEEGLIPPGWSSTGSEWLFGSAQDAGMDSLNGNLSYFNTTGSANGTVASLITPVFKVEKDTVYYTLLYHNSDGDDSLTIYYSLDEGNTWIRDTVLSTSSSWDSVTSHYIVLNSKASFISFKLEGTGDGGGSNIGVDEFKVLEKSIPTSIRESVKRAEWKIHCNTFSRKKLILYVEAVNSPIEVSLYDVAGRRIQSLHITENGRYELNPVHEGLYFLKIRGGEREEIRRIIYTR